MAPGDVTDAQMELLADLAERHASASCACTHDAEPAAPRRRSSRTYELWRALEAAGLATPNIGTLTDMICCPGLDFCSLANAGSIAIAKLINERFDDYDYLYDLGDLEVKMSGCMNACGHHHIGHIGILGVDKHGEEWYQITIGGSGRRRCGARRGHRSLGGQGQVPRPSAGCSRSTCESAGPEERFLDSVRRLGVRPFKERVYATSAAA